MSRQRRLNLNFVRITFAKKVLRGLRYGSLPKLINRKIEICSIETIESSIFSILGGDLPADSRLISNEKIRVVRTIAKYGIMDAEFSISNRHLVNCPLIDKETFRELGFILSSEDKECVTQNPLPNGDEDVGLLDFLANDIEKKEAIIKLFLRCDAPKLSLKLPKDFFPREFTVQDACMTNSGYVWLNKHFYL